MKLTDKDAATVDKMREFLEHAGPPDGHARERLVAAGREDLLAWALGQSVGGYDVSVASEPS